jgi:gliding motility-associated-like protein
MPAPYTRRGNNPPISRLKFEIFVSLLNKVFYSMKSISLSILVCFTLAPLSLFSQCPITVSAGPDKFVCNPGGTVDLEGSITGDFLGFRWTPVTNLANPTTLTPTATVNGTLIYTLSAGAEDPNAPNLVVNPGFEDGNTGFTSNYAYNPLPITPGTYTLTPSPEQVVSNFPPCDDHTYGDGTGNLMLVNGNGSNNSTVWCQTIAVMPNSWYVMSAWALVSPISPPVFQFVINNANVGPQASIPFNGCTWQQFSASWYSGAATSATFCIRDVSGSGNGLFGDDYALDDIFFAKGCTVTDQVAVSVVTVNAQLPATTVLGCNALQSGIQLNGSASSSGPGFVYSWSGPGILAGENTPIATVNEPGTYTLTVSFDTGDVVCTDEATINVLPDPNAVDAFATAAGTLTCANATAALSGNGSSTGGTISYSWIPAANVVSGGNTLNPIVNQPGVYTLQVSNILGNCTATATANMTANTTPPVAAAASVSGTLNCTPGSTVTLNGSGSASGAGTGYLWSGPGIVSGANTLNQCVVNIAGTYTLVVTSPANGCTATATTAVQPNSAAPTASAVPQGAITCLQDTVVVNSAGSSAGTDYVYQWSTLNGNISGPTNGSTITATAPGTYTLAVTHLPSGCSSLANAVVQGQFTVPVVAFPATPPAFTCATDSVQINTTATGAPAFTYQWATPNGILLSGATTATPWTGSAGIYLVTVTNTANGCTAAATTSVDADLLAPTAVASPDSPGQLTCQLLSITLNSMGSTRDSTVVYQWSSPNGGGFVGSTQDTLVVVDTVAMYILSIRDTLNGCVGKDTVVVTGLYDNPPVQIAPVPFITCVADSITIDASGSAAGSNLSFLWSTPNGIILSGGTGLTPVVGAAGSYSLSVTNADNGCTTLRTVTIGVDTLPPVAAIGPPGLLNCGFTQQTLQGSGSAGTTVLWSYQPAAGGAGPGIVAGQSTFNPVVDAPGTYTMTLADTVNGCTQSLSVDVQQDIASPVAEAGPAPQVDCSATTALVDGSGSSVGPHLRYDWSSGATTAQATVSLPGWYYLSVTDTQNQCVSIDSVLVPPFGGVPDVDAGIGSTITCLQSQVTLNGSGSIGAPYSYAWTFQGSGAGLVGGANSLSALAGSGGTYTLVVTNNQTGCTASDIVVIDQDAEVPVADAGTNVSLICGVSQLTLDGSLSSTGAAVSYLWTTTNGNIVQGGDGLTPVVNAPGVYNLVVTNLNSNCTATDAVVVVSDSDAPQISIAPPSSLTCTVGQVTLQGSSSVSGSGIVFTWTTPDGSIVSAGQLSAVVNAGGTYVFQVFNTNNNCTASVTTVVGVNQQAPTALLAASPTLTCNLPSVALTSTGSSTGSNFNYNWSGPGITGGGTTPTAVVNLPGAYTLTITDTTNGCSATASVDVAANTALPAAAAQAPLSITCLAPTVLLSGTGASVGNDFAYTWSGPAVLGGGTTLAPTVGQAGVYTLLVTNVSSGCTSTAQATVLSNTTTPTANAGASGLLTCSNTQLQLAGSGSSGSSFSYLWTGPGILSGGDTPTPTIDQAGAYVLLVTNTANGCTATASVTVAQNIQPPLAFAAAPTGINCVQGNVNISGTGSTVSGCTYQWSGPGIQSGGSGLSPVVNAPGLYVLTVTRVDNGCIATATAIVTADLSLPNAGINLPQVIGCSPAQIALDANSSSNGPDFSFSWAGPGIVSGGNTLTPQVNTPGLYTLTITNNTNQCTRTASVTVFSNTTPPLAVAQAPQPITCTTTQVSLQGAGSSTGPSFNYQWSGPGILSGAQTLTPLVNQPGNYQLVVFGSINGCTQSATATVPANTAQPVVSINSPFVLPCSPPTAALQAGSPVSGATYSWSTQDGQLVSGQGTATPVIGQAGTYAVVVTDPSNGCTNATQVVIGAPNPVFAAPVATVPTCASARGSILFSGGTGPYLYSIDAGNSFSDQQEYSQLPSGTYQTVVRDALGCEETQSIALPAVAFPNLNLIANAVVQAGNSYQIELETGLDLSQLVALSWSPATGLSCTDCPEPLAAPEKSTTYTVRVVSSSGCADSASIYLRVKGELGMYVPNVFDPGQPGDNQFFRPYTRLDLQQYHLQLFDRWGSLLFESFEIDKGWDGRAKGSPQLPGVYAYVIRYVVENEDGILESRYKFGDVLLLGN